MAAHDWCVYVERVLVILEDAGRPFFEVEDTQLNQEELSLKYSARKANILLTPISGQLFPPLPLPTISFVDALFDIIGQYPKSIISVSLASAYRYTADA